MADNLGDDVDPPMPEEILSPAQETLTAGCTRSATAQARTQQVVDAHLGATRQELPPVRGVHRGAARGPDQGRVQQARRPLPHDRPHLPPPAHGVEEVGGQARGNGRPIRFGLNGFAVLRDTEAEAVEVVEEIIANADQEKVRGFAEAVRQAGASAPNKKEDMWANSEFKDLAPYNDAFRTALIGTAGQVARQVLAYKLVGADRGCPGSVELQWRPVEHQATFTLTDPPLS